MVGDEAPHAHEHARLQPVGHVLLTIDILDIEIAVSQRIITAWRAVWIRRILNPIASVGNDLDDMAILVGVPGVVENRRRP